MTDPEIAKFAKKSICEIQLDQHNGLTNPFPLRGQ